MKNFLMFLGLFLTVSLATVSCAGAEENADETTEASAEGGDEHKCAEGDKDCCKDKKECKKGEDGKCEGKCADKCGAEGKCGDADHKCGDAEGEKCGTDHIEEGHCGEGNAEEKCGDAH